MKINERIYKVSGVEYGTNSNIYAIKYDGGIILIDSGYQEKQWNIMLECMCQWNMKPDDITHVFITHSHFDHAGNIWRANKLGAKVLASKIDAEKIENGNPEMEELFGSKWICGKVDEILAIENVYEFPGDVKIQVLGTPGHSSGSVSFLIDAGGDRALCIGDMFFVSPVPPKDEVESELGYMGSEDFSLEQFVESMEMFENLETDIILPGHYYFYKGVDTKKLIEDAYEKSKKLLGGQND